MSNEKIRAMMAKKIISYQVCEVNVDKITPISGAKFDTEIQAEVFILDPVATAVICWPLTIIKIFE